jgi:predicted transcriptional regulator
VPILEMISQGIICSDIAKKLNISKSLVSYYIKRAKEKNLVKEILRDTFKSIQITQAGKNFLDQYDKNQLSVPICRAENIRFKAVITQMPTVPVDWKRIEMHNWTQYSSQIDGIKVRLNIGATPILELLPSPIEGDNPYDLFTINVYECYNVLLDLYYKIGLKVGNFQLGSRCEWVVYDPIAKAFCKHNGQVTYEGIAKVNASKPLKIGEFEFHDPRALKDYLLMPYRLKNIEDRVGRILELLEQKNSRSEILDRDKFQIID